MNAISTSVNALINAVTGARRVSTSRVPNQNPLERVFNTLLFATHTQSIPSLRTLHALLGRYTRVFGGETATTFNDVTGLMAREPEKIDWLSGPIDDRADYLTKGYVPFLLAGPNHALRRARIVAKVAQAHSQLPDLEALLTSESDPDRALTRFLFRHLCSVELDDTETAWFVEYRHLAQPMVLLPKWLRTSPFLKGRHELLQQRREYFLKKIEATGEPFADSWFDVLWFQTATLSFYPEKALAVLREQRSLQPAILDELDRAPNDRPKTRALIHEMLRIHGRIASTNYVEQGRVRIALMATAVVDPARYHEPYTVNLSRDHSDTLAFSGPAPSRKCPGELFAPDAMAAIVAVSARKGALERAS